MQRRQYSREVKPEAVNMIRERGVSVAQASRDLGVHQTVLGKWVSDVGSDPVSAFPGHGQMKPEQLEIALANHTNLPEWGMMALILSLATMLILVLLQPAKGAIIAVQW